MSEVRINDVGEQLAFIESANDLREVNDLLTQLMATQKIQRLIKDDQLSAVVDAVVDLALAGDGNEQENRLIATAVLGRLSAVARGRESTVFSRVAELLEEPPIDVEILADGDEKYYAALTISCARGGWLFDYCVRQALIMDTAEKARRIFISTALHIAGDCSLFWQRSSKELAIVRDLKSSAARFRRVRRISNACYEAVKEWQMDVGTDAGLALGDWAAMLLSTDSKDVEISVLSDIVDDCLGMLLRIIELRFSHALLAPTYDVLDKVRSKLGRDRWANVVRECRNVEKVRICLKEAALVIARQNRTDNDLMGVLAKAYYSKSQVAAAMSSHFASARELEPEVKRWWEQAGLVAESERQTEHKMGNPEDQQIGSLLINVEESKSVMEKLERAVVPFLEISDPPLAETVKRAAGRFSEIALATRQLATMRKLKHMDLRGAFIEYNPMQHDMLGGHRLGIRMVRVERDGIQKDFGGKVKVLVKPRVAEENK